jgi:hypothetical protein
MLTDDLTGQQIYMRTTPCFVYNSGQGGLRRFSITTGNAIQYLRFTSTQVQRGRTRAGATIQCGLTVPAEVTLRIRNTGGRLVRTLGPVKVDAQGLIAWDGNDDNGRGLPAGMYIGELYAEATDGQRIRATVLISTRN